MTDKGKYWAKRNLKPGVRYRVRLSDCCIEGELEGTFLELTDEEDGEFYAARFDFGTLGPDWGAWEAEEVPSADQLQAVPPELEDRDRPGDPGAGG